MSDHDNECPCARREHYCLNPLLCDEHWEARIRAAVAEEISQAIETDARDEWTLGRDWVAVAAAIARRVGGVSE